MTVRTTYTPRGFIRDENGREVEDRYMSQEERDRLKTANRNAERASIGQNGNTVYYGGSAGDFQNAVNRNKDVWAARGRAGYDWDESGYEEAKAGAAQARTEQLSGLERMRNLMDTSQSSAASRDVLAGGQQAAQGAQSLATVAKGGLVGQRGAMSQAQQTGGMVQQQAAQQAGILRQQEAADATLKYGQAAAAMRSGDAEWNKAAFAEAEGRAGAELQNMEQNAMRERANQDRLESILKAQQASQQGAVRTRMDLNDETYARENGVNNSNAAAQNAMNNALMGGVAGAGQAAAAASSSANAYDQAQARNAQSQRQQRDDDNYYSDRDLKESVQSLSDRIASKTPGYSFHYKPGVRGEDPGKKNFGIMAQDLEKTPEGASVVKEGPQGKMVDTGKLTLLHQAMMHDLNKRLRSLEKKR